MTLQSESEVIKNKVGFYNIFDAKTGPLMFGEASMLRHERNVLYKQMKRIEKCNLSLETNIILRIWLLFTSLVVLSRPVLLCGIQTKDAVFSLLSGSSPEPLLCLVPDRATHIHYFHQLKVL